MVETNLKQSLVAQLGRSLMTIAEGLVRQAGPLYKDDHFQRSLEKPWVGLVGVV